MFLKRLTVTLFIFFFSIGVHAKFLNSEQRTVKAGFESLQWLQFLHAVSKKCDDFEYAELASRQELDLIVQEKLKVNIEKLEVWVEENHALDAVLYEQLNKVNCNVVDVKEVLSNIYDAYDLAKFNLELYEPISQPLMTQGELAKENERALLEYVSSRSNEAETIMIAEIIAF